MRKSSLIGGLVILTYAVASTAFAQTFVELRQEITHYNLQKLNGVPISDVVGVPKGSDGRAPGVTFGPMGTSNQFKSIIGFGAVVAPKGENLDPTQSFAANAARLDLPRFTDTTTKLFLLSARVGAPYVARSVSFLFGAVVPVPSIDEYGVPLSIVNTNINPNRPILQAEQYWMSEPYSPSNHVNERYYWSPHARRVFAVTPGQLTVSWRKATPSVPVGSPPDVSPVVIDGLTNTILHQRYLVSGSPVKRARQMYWTEGDFSRTGKRITVPDAQVGDIFIVFNDNFPERVQTPYPLGTSIAPDDTNVLSETRTLWFDKGLSSISAYNLEGRAFVELLGDAREDRITRQHLGFEIVEITKEPTPHDVGIELGELLTAYASDIPDDSNLFPEPILNPAQTYAYEHLGTSSRSAYYGVRETLNLNDLQVHWMEEGLAGLKWPYRFVRYALRWPAEIAKYSHYIRPFVNNEAQARTTAIPLPNENAPYIEYQDPLDQIRGKLTEQFQYYTFLTPEYPAHRALLRFTSGEYIRFERVFSWLDASLRSSAFAGSVAAELSSWDENLKQFNWPDDFITPRVVTGIVNVGTRISAPAGEIGSGLDQDYLTGYIVQPTGTSFHPTAYKDPFVDGFEEANKGAIIPINAIPGSNLLEVMWFRKNFVNPEHNFKNVLWPSVIARYTLQWPANASEIVLASNDGSGGLPSLQANGAIYYQNAPDSPGYNPNEEHALMQGGQAYALRDDLNITSTNNYSSEPYVLLEYVEADGRPAVRPFKVVREKPEAGLTFNYQINAGTILQPPMPLPLLEKPFAPKVAGRPLKSLNVEASVWTVHSSTEISSGEYYLGVTIATRPIFPSHQTFMLQHPTKASSHGWYFVTSIEPDTNKLNGVVSLSAPVTIGPWTVSPQPANPLQWKYYIGNPTSLSNVTVLVAAPEKLGHWIGTVKQTGSENDVNFIVVEFASTRPPAAEGSSILLKLFNLAAEADFVAGWELSSDLLPQVIEDSTVRQSYAKFTFQDRKGNQWVYRGPHDPALSPVLYTQFYYKTLPGFYFPVVSAGEQPPVGTITPYLRLKRSDGTFIGNPVRGNADSDDQNADGDALAITYRPLWPATTPVLEMGETLTLPKRGLPAIRGQTSLELLYQQSHTLPSGLTNRSVVLHDPTREKEFYLGSDPSSTSVLGVIPDSIETSVYRGKTYFPNLPPHLADRFYLDPDRGEHGALVFHGVFVDAPLGDKYLHLNVLGRADMAALKSLCVSGDSKSGAWKTAIDSLQTYMELFVENPARPGTYIPDTSATALIAPSMVAEVQDDDVAVDSYALSAVGPGAGYITLVAGNGSAFTPAAEPVSLHIIRVVDTLYRGEVNVVQSSNPLNEQLTLQQVVDLAGNVDDYTFEWKIASPVDGLPPAVHRNEQRTVLGNGTWSHLLAPRPSDQIANVLKVPLNRVTKDILSSIRAVSTMNFLTVSNDLDRFYFRVVSHPLVTGNQVVIRKQTGEALYGTVHASTTPAEIVIERDPNQTVEITAAEIAQLHERPVEGERQSIVFREFTVPSGNYSQYWLSLDLDDALGARVYLDGQLLVTANSGNFDTPENSPPATLLPLSKSYLLSSAALAGGTHNSDGSKSHLIVVELYSASVADALQSFNVRLEAFASVDVTASQWLPMDPIRFEDGVRAILGGNADVRSLADNYLIMRYQAKTNIHASWVSDSSDPLKNIGWSQWTSPQLAEGWIKRVLAGINPFNQRVDDLFNNEIDTDVSIVQQAGPRWEGNVALNMDSINDFGLIEIYETVLNQGKMLSIDGGINYGPANDALLLAAGYLNDLYIYVGNEAWADAANPTIGIGTKDNTYGAIATALFAFKGQLPSLLDEELALLRGRDDLLLPGVEMRPLYNRIPWNFTRGIDAGEVIYSLNYNILDQNVDGVVDAEDAQELFPQGHGDAYGHYLTAIKGYYSLLLDPNFDWVPRMEAVTVLGKPVSVDYQDERKFASAAAALARVGKQIFDLTWRKDFQSGSANGWEHFSSSRDNTTTRNLTTTRYWGVDHWASRTGQGAFLNWVVGNAILPDHDTNPAHEGSIQQVDRTSVPELKELPAISQSLQTALDNAESGLLPLGIPANTIPFDLNPLFIINGANTTHFEQVYQRAKDALNNAMIAFDEAKDVTRLMRSEQDSLADFRTTVQKQEMAYSHLLVELYGSPYPEDIGPGRTYDSGYSGPDLIHYMYVDNKELTFGSLLDPRVDTQWRIDIQTFTPNWLDAGDGISTFSFIEKARIAPVDGTDPRQSYLTKTNLFVEYTLPSHGFFKKPQSWVGKRATPGRAQQAVSDIIKARNAAFEAFYKADAAKYDLDWALLEFEHKKDSHAKIRDWKSELLATDRAYNAAKVSVDIYDKAMDATKEQISAISQAASHSIPTMLIVGLASGGDMTAPLRGAVEQAGVTFTTVRNLSQVIKFSTMRSLEYLNELNKQLTEFFVIGPEEWSQELRNSTSGIRDKVYGMNNQMMAVNHALQELDDAYRAYQSVIAEGERIQTEREVFRQRSAAVIQGFRTRDAAFRVFRDEKLERYKTVFDLAAQYTFMAAQSFDYDTGLLHTDEGQDFINRIVRARALGLMQNGEPQFAGSDTGDPGLSSVMAEMNADWSVLKGRLGFKNPDAYGTTASLRFEHFRILPGSDGDMNWQDVLNAARKANILEDSDVRRYCMQIDQQNGLPVPGIILEFSTTIADGLNLFGRPLSPGDHAFSPSSFATKIFGVGVALDGYKGMDDPVANGSAIDSASGVSPADPSTVFLDPEALAANPYVYLIPVGLDSMRSPPLGDASVIRTWSIEDVAIPLPFNIGGSEFSTAPFWQSSDSLTEPLFTVRKHQAFRPVSSPAVFGTLVVYWNNGALQRSQYNNTRLLGRSAWNSKWKIIIPGRTLLNDPNEGLDRFTRSVRDVKLYFMTYSYAGN